MKKVIATYYGIPFEFALTKQDESYYEGVFNWDEKNWRRYLETNQKHEDENDTWYLDDNGYRLEDEALFKKSPWTIIEDGKATKAVNRLLKKDGEAWFAVAP